MLIGVLFAFRSRIDCLLLGRGPIVHPAARGAHQQHFHHAASDGTARRLRGRSGSSEGVVCAHISSMYVLLIEVVVFGATVLKMV